MDTAEQVTDPCAYHAEGPVWWPAWGGLRWVDMLAGDVLALDQVTGVVSRQHVADVVAALRPRRSGGLVAAVERGFALIGADGSVQPLGELWSDPGVRMNEGGCDPDGRFYAGSMRYDTSAGGGSLYVLEPDRSVRRVIDGVTISNGLAWSPDGAVAYYVDTATQQVDAFSYDAAGGLHDRRDLFAIPAEAGAPDGITVDAEGMIFVALYGGGAVRRYRPDGVLDGIVEVPVRRVTACTLGGPGLTDLYVTTSREGADPEPEAGAVFRCRVGVPGLPATTFAG
jgi:sugar lactone lactonase YvrE